MARFEYFQSSRKSARCDEADGEGLIGESNGIEEPLSGANAPGPVGRAFLKVESQRSFYYSEIHLQKIF